ncbi:MAG: hypothetical protein RR263_01725 [Oscillospiraceae bacterium]
MTKIGISVIEQIYNQITVFFDYFIPHSHSLAELSFLLSIICHCLISCILNEAYTLLGRHNAAFHAAGGFAASWASRRLAHDCAAQTAKKFCLLIQYIWLNLPPCGILIELIFTVFAFNKDIVFRKHRLFCFKLE